MRYNMLKTLARWHACYPGRMLVLVIGLTVLSGILASKLTVTMRWSDLLPAGDKRTLEYNRIVDEFVTASSIIVVVQGDEKRIKAFADTIAPRIEKAVLETDTGTVRLIQRVDYKAETAFLKRHGLMLIKKADLENSRDIFTDPNLEGVLRHINDAMEKEYVGRQESISSRMKEDRAVTFLDGIDHLVSVLQQLADNNRLQDQTVHSAVERLLFGETYFLSYDKEALILNAVPTFSVMDLGLVVQGTEKVQHILDETLSEFPDVRAGLTGFLPICHDEMVYSEKSLGITSVIALVAILILLIISFRMWVAPMFAMGNLLIGILWAVGLVAVTVGQLNIMTQMMAVILIGLGIDFSIHLISGFTEFRARNQSIQSALETTFLKIGRGVITGGLTTACAFLALTISHSRGLKEMGLVTGLGLLATLFATFLTLPLLLVLRERHREKKADQKKRVVRNLSFVFLGKTAVFLGKNHRITLLISLCLTGLMIWAASRITFDQNYMNIEAKGLVSVALQDTVLEKFDLSTDYAMLVTTSPEKSNDIAEQYREKGTVAMVDDIAMYLPDEEDQVKRRPMVAQIRAMMNEQGIRPLFGKEDQDALVRELKRLRMNVMEMQDMAFIGGQDKVERQCSMIVGEPDMPHPGDRIAMLIRSLAHTKPEILTDFQIRFAPYFKTSVLNMASSDAIRMSDLPVTVLDRYSNASRDRFLVTVYPAGHVWQDAAFLRRFVSDIETVSDRSTGMPPVFLALIDIIGEDGRRAMMLTVIIVFLILWIDFRNMRHALLAMIPLATGLVWMIGLMKVTGQQFTVMNVMGLPMILGIGIDDGVHVVHRWVAEGKRNLYTVFASTGKAILLTTLTTMLGFGSLIFSVWRGFGQLGAALFVGVGACFLTTVLLLSALMGWMDKRRRIKESTVS